MGSPTRVDVSVVVPAYRAEGTLARCVESLLAQGFDGSFEILVLVSGGGRDVRRRLPQDPRLQVTTSPDRVGAAAARNRAAERARGAAIAFTDADVVAETDWLQRLWEASGGRLCVAGAVANGTPASAIGTAEYLLQFSDLTPARPPGSVHFGATCNLLVPRTIWESYGPFPVDMYGGEDTLLTTRLREQGLFAFEPRAVVTHLNRTSLKDLVSHQYDFGRFCARLARREPGSAKTTLRWLLQRQVPLAPLAAAGKAGWLIYRAAAGRRLMEAFRCLPFVVIGVLAWAAGLAGEGVRMDWMGGRPKGASSI